MNDASALGGGYVNSKPNPMPTIKTVLKVAKSGSVGAQLIIIAGPPCVGKSLLGSLLVRKIPESLVLDKDLTAGGFILQAASANGQPSHNAYSSDYYWKHLRPIEYAGPMAVACENLVNQRRVLLVGGWAPELGVATFCNDLEKLIEPSRLIVIYLNPPDINEWQQRLKNRGSQSDSEYVNTLVRTMGNLPIWSKAIRLSSMLPPNVLAQAGFNAIKELSCSQST